MTFQKISSKSSKSLTPRKEGHHETPGLEFSRLFFFLGIEDRSQVSKEGNGSTSDKALHNKLHKDC